MFSLRGLGTWFMERFPPMNFLSGFFLFWLPLLLAIGTVPPAERTFHAAWIPATLIPALHLFLLRVFDEHKDFESDRVNNPNRALQRGVVQLSQIRALGIASALLQAVLFFSLRPSTETVICFVALWIWTLLMAREFFAAEWLKRHFFLYAFSHLLITPLILLLCSRMAGTPPSYDLSLIALGILSGFIYEVARKTKAPAEETGDQSYSKLWGRPFSCAILAVTGIFLSLNGAVIFQKAGLTGWIPTALLAALLILHFLSLGKFLKKPTPKARRSNEGTSALIGLAIFLIPIALLW